MGLDICIDRVKHSEIGYFRKVNFLVKFFEKKGFNIRTQEPITVKEEDAEELLDLCNQVLEDHSKAEELLPTMNGFFFGSTDYNEYYFENVKSVKEWIENTLLPEFNTLKDEDGTFETIEFYTWY